MINNRKLEDIINATCMRMVLYKTERVVIAETMMIIVRKFNSVEELLFFCSFFIFFNIIRYNSIFKRIQFEDLLRNSNPQPDNRIFLDNPNQKYFQDQSSVCISRFVY